MSLLPFEQELQRASPGPAFSNGFEGDAWMDYWCSNCRHCLPQGSCELITVALLGQVPFPWERLVANSLHKRYVCHEFSSRVEVPPRFVPDIDAD